MAVLPPLVVLISPVDQISHVEMALAAVKAVGVVIVPLTAVTAASPTAMLKPSVVNMQQIQGRHVPLTCAAQNLASVAQRQTFVLVVVSPTATSQSQVQVVAILSRELSVIGKPGTWITLVVL